ncbi:WD40 repeat-like protein [Testicularia cyperi]|uniref:WD40 repeat-like protein n=1 Tax=Testicularia cyperi TaxID=1882483 RepID=A0A317XXI8_9BASI|nr:WD40 repeat-like protein [Testicularia cyperi]
MADAQVLTPQQIQQMLAAQQASSASTSAAAVPTASATDNNAAAPLNRLKTSFTKRRTLEAFYTGGATAFSPDGRLLFSTLNEHVAVVEVSSGRVIHKIEGDTEEVTALAVSPSGEHLVIASRSLFLRIFSIQHDDFRMVRSIPKSHLSQVNLMAIDPTSTLLATGGSDGVAKVWDLEGGYCTHAFKGHAGVVSALCWNMPNLDHVTSASSSSAGKAKSKAKAKRTIELVTGSVDGRVRVWDLNNPAELHKPIHTLTGHDSVVRGIGITDDGTTLVSGARDRTVVVWKHAATKSGKPGTWTQADTLSAEEGIETLGFLPRGTSIGSSVGGSGQQVIFWTGGSAGEMRLWDVSTGSIVAKEPKSYNEIVAQRALEERRQRAIAAGRSVRELDNADDDDEETRAITAIHLLLPTSSRTSSSSASSSTTATTGLSLASVHADQNIVLRSVADDSTPLTKQRQLIGFNDEIVDVTLLSSSSSSTKESHLAVATNSRAVRVYTVAADDASEDTTAELLTGHTDIVLCLDRSPDLRLLASGAKDRTVRIWAWIPSSRLASTSSHSNGSNGVGGDGLDDEGTRVPRSNAKDGARQDQDTGEWICVGVCEGHAESVGAVAFARRSTTPGAAGAPFLVTASQDRTVKIWDLAPVNSMLTSSASIGGPAKLKSLVTQRIHEKDINCLDVSPNNAMVASGSQDRTCKLFSLAFTAPSKSNRLASARLSALATLKGHKRGVWACKFSPVDLAIATSSGDKTVRMWSLRDFSCVKIFEGHTNSVLKLSFLSTGMQLLSCGGDGLLKLWNVKDEECISTMDAHDEKVWSLVVSRDESTVWTSAADSSIAVWQDRSREDQEEQNRLRQQEVEHEQEFTNFLTRRDWRNAIVLALGMGQPRRLLGLFAHVAQSRPEADGVGAGLLGSALRRDAAHLPAAAAASNGYDVDMDDDDDDDDESDEESEDELLLDAAVDPSAAALSRAGISNGGTSGKRADGSKANGTATTGSSDPTPSASSSSSSSSDADSITGLCAVDQVLAELTGAQLIQLLIYIRDWNTSTRTSSVAQTVLHAILRYYSASYLISLFSTSSKSWRETHAKQLEQEELGILPPLTPKEQARATRDRAQKQVDLASLLDALLPYTQRHFDRADRTLVESSLVEYSLEAMDTLIGFELDDSQNEDQDAEEDGDNAEDQLTHVTFGQQLGQHSETDDDDNPNDPDPDADADADQDEDEDDTVMSDASL